MSEEEEERNEHQKEVRAEIMKSCSIFSRNYSKTKKSGMKQEKQSFTLIMETKTQTA